VLQRSELICGKMSALVGFFVDNLVFVVTGVVVFVSILVAALRLKRRTNGKEAVAGEFQVEDAHPRALKKSAKPKPKKTKREKVCYVDAFPPPISGREQSTCHIVNSFLQIS